MNRNLTEFEMKFIEKKCDEELKEIKSLGNFSDIKHQDFIRRIKRLQNKVV